ncbi:MULTISPECIES: hypothetical protein [unclassified Nitrosospira]|uniref:hypothetical protein n=1 Tax=unclassified Nitrosospira TaxID=2609267 RepID=UPI00115F88D5|nr:MULTISPECIES: hypothetical protein [unclassified Nitrosospira]
MPKRTRPTGSEPLKNECISSKQADHSRARQICESGGVSSNSSPDPVTIFALLFILAEAVSCLLRFRSLPPGNPRSTYGPGWRVAQAVPPEIDLLLGFPTFFL